MNLEVFFKLEMLSSIKERILNNSIALFFGICCCIRYPWNWRDDHSCYGIIMSVLMAEDYVLQSGCGERILKNATYLFFVNVK